MLKSSLLPLFLATASLTACSGLTGEALRYPVPVVEPAEKVRVTAYRSIEVRQVSLPEYATLSEMAVERDDGGISTERNRLWADNPVRSVTLELARNLGQITGTTVASEPWPFDDHPDARIEVRIEEMLADQSGNFRLSGQFFVAPTGESGRAVSHVFALAAPIAEGQNPSAVAAARGQIVINLALLIAKKGLK